MELREILESVEDPELERTMGQLGMISEVKESRKSISVSIHLPGIGYSQVDELRARIVSGLESAGVKASLEIDFVPMDESEQLELSLKLIGVVGGLAESAPGSDSHGAAGHDGAGHGAVDHEGAGHGAAGHGAAGHKHGSDTGVATNLPAHTRVLGIASGKGGVGKSSVSVNLALALASIGKKVSILDADVYGFSVPAMLGIDHPPMAIDKLIIPPMKSVIRCLSMGYFVAEDQPVIWRGPMLHKALEQFLTDSWWGAIDYLIIDMPPGTGDVTLSLAQYLPNMEIFVVTTPQPAAQRVAQRSAYASKKLRLSVRGVIENMSWFTGDDGTRYEIFGSGGGALLADTISVALIGQIPISVNLRKAGDTGTASEDFDVNQEAKQAFIDIATRIDQMKPTKRRSPELKLV